MHLHVHVLIILHLKFAFSSFIRVSYFIVDELGFVAIKRHGYLWLYLQFVSFFIALIKKLGHHEICHLSTVQNRILLYKSFLSSYISRDASPEANHILRTKPYLCI